MLPRLQPSPTAPIAALLLWSTVIGCAPLDVISFSSGDVPITESRRARTITAGTAGRDASSPPSIVHTAAEFEIDAEESPLTDPHTVEIATPIEWHTEIVTEHRGTDTQYTMAQVVAHAKTNHPLVHAASRQIDVARAGITTASTKANPNFVLVFDTPLHDKHDASELASRITFPFGASQERQWRRRVAMAQVIKAEANFQATLRQVSDAATATALRSIYLQQRLAIDSRAEQLARDLLDAISEGMLSDDPGKNLLRRVDARTQADKATQQRFTTQRDLAVTHAAVTNSMGSNQRQAVLVLGSLDPTQLGLPSLDDVIASTVHDSEQIVVALAELNESRLFHCLQRNIGTDKEFGPRYRDRLGRDDDRLGLRLDVDLDIHRVQSGPIAQSAHATHQQRDRVAVARHQWIGEVTRIYRTLESLAAEIAYYGDDGFISDQRALLDDEPTAKLMTAAQKLKIEQAIVQRQLEQLQRHYTFAVLRSQIQLDLGIE